LAHKLAKKLRCPEISVDWLRSVVAPYLNSADKTVLENILFKRQGQDTAKDETEILWPAVKSFTEDKGRWPGDFVIDGIQLLPRYINQIATSIQPKIRVIYLVKTDAQKILHGFEQVRSRKNDWLLKGHGHNQPYLAKVAQEIAQRGQYFAAEAKQYGFSVINTEDNFADSLNALVEALYAERKRLKKTER